MHTFYRIIHSIYKIRARIHVLHDRVRPGIHVLHDRVRLGRTNSVQNDPSSRKRNNDLSHKCRPRSALCTHGTYILLIILHRRSVAIILLRSRRTLSSTTNNRASWATHLPPSSSIIGGPRRRTSGGIVRAGKQRHRKNFLVSHTFSRWHVMSFHPVI